MIIRDRSLWVGSVDLSGHTNGIAGDFGIEPQDDTVHADDARSSVAGLETNAIQLEGVWDAGTALLPDDVFATNKSLSDMLATLAPVDAAVGSVAYFMRTSQGLYTFGGAVGDLNRFSTSLRAQGGHHVVRGTIMANGTETTTDDGTAVQLGAVAAGKHVFAGLHVLSASASDTLDVIVESDDEEAFGGSPSTRITFSQVADEGWQWATPVAGAITDDWWRVGWTIGGSSPSFQFVVVVGIR